PLFEVTENQKSLPLDKTVQIYPNPADNDITIEIDNNYTGNIQIIISDDLGRKRKEYNIYKNFKKIKYNKNLSTLKTGNYMIELIFGKIKVNRLLVLKR
ncbi:MAG: T9SS type A sorting domain-containing protein, partial [Chlorobi bacterium]|nr:T9SS type A sorting domain-containing protein [Chlorobiota bacterium]